MGEKSEAIRGGLTALLRLSFTAAALTSTGCAGCGEDSSSVPGRDMNRGSDLDLSADINQGAVERACTGGVDDDNDGAIDCEDSDCLLDCACRDCGELCENDLDDDGDGVVNEQCPCDELGELGVCSLSTINAKQACQPPPSYQVNESLCDGLDNDCDGVADEGCRCRFSAGHSGVCLSALVSFSGECQAPLRYQIEESACDGFDNDCDGGTDEGCTLCDFQGSSQGACLYGVVGVDANECLPPQAYQPSEVQCASDGFNGDHVDNDCDGVVDEGCFCLHRGSSQGLCARGVIDGATGACGAPLGFEVEEKSCDGRDNDCDGQIDEGCDRCEFTNPTVGGSQGSGVCAYGQKQGEACEPPAGYSPQERECVLSLFGGDGRDNDCDGVVDEGCACPYQGSRQGVCADSVIEPLEGRCSQPSHYEPGERSCADGRDNDCDGRTDHDDPDCDVSMTPDMGGGDMMSPDMSSPDMPPPAGDEDGTSCPACYDGLDNDNDNRRDCVDPDCASKSWCVPMFGPQGPLPGCPGEDTFELCHDGLDNDGDGYFDCHSARPDQECANDYSGPNPHCQENLQFGPDRCSNNIDEDGDGKTDCEDESCQGTLNCTEGMPPATCSNGIDEDKDGDTDCADLDCAGVPPCP